MHKCAYAGSFDCYTNGHHDIVKKASELFDEVHILVATNGEKQRTFPEDKMRELIEEAIADDGIVNCCVSVCSGIVAEYANEHGIKYLVRGLRNAVDFNYEENLASINRLICPELETVYLRANNTAISSSVVRGLLKNGKDISPYVPLGVAKYLESFRQGSI